MKNAGFFNSIVDPNSSNNLLIHDIVVLFYEGRKISQKQKLYNPLNSKYFTTSWHNESNFVNERQKLIILS